MTTPALLSIPPGQSSATTLPCGRQGSVAPIETPRTVADRERGIRAPWSLSPRWIPAAGRAMNPHPVDSRPVAPDPAISLRSRRRDGGLVKGRIDRLNSTGTDGRGPKTSGSVDAPVNAGRFIEPAAICSLPTGPRMRAATSMTPQSPAAFKGSDDAAKDTPTMAQQEPRLTRLTDTLFSAEKQAIRLATHPDSPDGSTTTPEELLHIQTLRQVRMEMERYAAGVQVAVKMIRLGPDAASLPRSLNELYDVPVVPEHHEDSMSR